VAYSRPGDAPHQEQGYGDFISGGYAVSQGRGHAAPAAIASTSDLSDSRMTEVAPPGAYSPGQGDLSIASDTRYLQPHTQFGSASVESQYQEYANTMSSMAHTRWSQGSVASPLRTELNAPRAVSRDFMASSDLPQYTHEQQTLQQYATLPRSGYGAPGAVQQTSSNGSSERGQLPPAAATNAVANNSILLQPWPPASPHIRTVNNNNSIGGRANHQPQVAGAHGLPVYGGSQTVEASPNILSDYYMVTSPNGQQLTEPPTPIADSASLLPMVEVGQGGARPMPASDMDEINAHSQEYLHRRRRRLTQTLHNRQRSGSAVDVVSRLSATRLNALPMSSPGTNSLTSNRSMEEVQSVEGDQHTIGRQRYQPQPAPQSTLSYAGAPTSYILHDELHSAAVMQAQVYAQAQAQAQTQALAHIQAQAQAEYLQQLQLERMQQERIQQERIQQERIQQEHMQAMALEQQRQKAKLAHEQELARFSEYHPLLSLTVYIAETYRKCHVDFSYDSARRPRRVLTDPSEGVENDGFDNKNSDYILYVNDIIGEQVGHQFLILEMLGSGTFGQVVKCQNTKTGELVAVKVIKNKPAYYKQSMMEVQMLSLLNNKYDIDDKHHILRLKESFVFRNHLVFVNELLSINLYDLLKQNQYQGLSTNLVRVLVQQILDAMIVMKQAEIIHADLKPENILLEDMEKPVVKVIDFGSACFEWQTSFTYIQSRFYRSPEILLGLPYSSRIDMWSLGCIVAELYLGLPLFPGSSEYNQLSRIIDLLGLPPTNMLERARRTDEFFNYLGPSTWDLKSMVQYAREHNTEEKQSKRYFHATTLEELITTYPIRRRVSEVEQQREYQSRFALIDFLRGLLHLDPDKRWSPQQAALHPFITGEPSVGAFVPPSVAGGGSHGPGSGSGSRPYGDSANSHQGHGHFTGADYHAQGGNGGYESLQSMGGGYPSYQGTKRHSAYLTQNDSGSGLSANGASPGYRQASQQPYSFAGPAPGDDNLRIPGAFPVGGARQPTQDSNGSLRATTIGRHFGGTVHLPETSAQTYQHATVGHSNVYAHQQAYPHTIQPNGFLDVDPSASHLSDILTVDSDSRGAPGRLDTSVCSSEYSAESSYGWTTRSEVNHINGHSSTSGPSVAGSYSTRAGSLYEHKMTGSALQRHFLFNERQQQRLAQQRPLAKGDFAQVAAAPIAQYDGDSDFVLQSAIEMAHASNSSTHSQPSPSLRCFPAARLVSNFSPLTIPSTPGSLNSSQQHGVGSIDAKLGSGTWSSDLGRSIWPSLVNGIKGAAASSIYQLPQYAAFSQEVLSRSGPACFGRERTNSGGDFVEFVESDKDNSPSEELAADSSWVIDDYESTNSVDNEGSVISQEEDTSGQDRDSLPPDDLDETASLLGDLEVRDSTRSMGGSDSETAARESDGYDELGGNVSYDDDDDDDDNDDDATDQDIVLFAGKLHPPQATCASNATPTVPAEHRRRLSNTNAVNASSVLSLDSQRSALLPLSRSSRCGSFASSYPQRIAKKPHLRRSDRPPPSAPIAPPLLLIKDSLRMVESLRRMGKWQDSTDLIQHAAHASRANQFYLDPVIISMSPRLMPPSG
ncbi:dual specificity protein kinase yak1, partial [Coemansia aciculifera]